MYIGCSGGVVGDVGGHFCGYTSCEGADLFVNVEQPGVGGPAAHLFGDGGVDAIELHRHGAAGPERVAANVVGVKPVCGEAQGNDCAFEVSVDVGRGDLFDRAIVEVGRDAGVRMGGMGRDVGHSSRQALLDRTGG